MAAERAGYRALKDISFNGVLAYRAGDPVDASAVEGPDAWLVPGEDAEPSGQMRLDRPAMNASQAAWAAYAVSGGMDAEVAAGMSRGDLIEATSPGG